MVHSFSSPVVDFVDSSLVGLQLVVVVVEVGLFHLETLALSDLKHDLVGLRAVLQDVTADQLPMREDHLREGLARRVLSEQLRETERLEHGQEGLDFAERRAGAIFLAFDQASLHVERGVDTGNGVVGHRDIAQVHGL